ncbi:hypothetical protein GCM10027290_57290 [Micromonospora sonneratiae]|uniref:Uncharacterized protein n=1 Tax=Micromonospora sonneratiae TaxID=1184706 RepID=A0ABW3YDX9_9ACTN
MTKGVGHTTRRQPFRQSNPRLLALGVDYNILLAVGWVDAVVALPAVREPGR